VRLIAFIRSIDMKIKRNILFIAGLICLGLSSWDANRSQPIKASAPATDLVHSILFAVLSFVAGIVLLIVAFRIHKKIRQQQALANDLLPPVDELEA
jgi:hypothetical protein